MNKQHVYDAYDEIVEWYDANRSKSLMEKEYLNLIIQSIPIGGSILDLGCGTGEPIAQFFHEKGYQITGVDGSRKMIELCQHRFPQQTFLVADMRHVQLNQQFDAIIAWHSFFHLSHDDQRHMFKLFESCLKPKGILVFTSGSEHGQAWSNNGGKNLYHASLAPNEYQMLLKQHHFEIILHKAKDPDCGYHTIWVARKAEM
ncbi:MAG: class I SAM-dependent DNA methyltransferase [Gammaproteobacteria bacterium]